MLCGKPFKRRQPQTWPRHPKRHGVDTNRVPGISLELGEFRGVLQKSLGGQIFQEDHDHDASACAKAMTPVGS